MTYDNDTQEDRCLFCGATGLHVEDCKSGLLGPVNPIIERRELLQEIVIEMVRRKILERLPKPLT